jgi:basic amino acid/polyamine antiporter, APA family
MSEGRNLAGNGSISVKVATAVGLGAIIGAGIFTLSGTAIALAGTWALASFILVGIVAVIVALEMGELCSLFPNAEGASYSYTYEAFGSELGFITGILLFFSYATSVSVVALGFGTYLASLLGVRVPNGPDYFAIVLIAALALVNLRGIRKAARADFALVVVKLGILVLVVGFAFAYFLHGGGSSRAFLSGGGSPTGLSGVFQASVAVFFAYSGFQAISTFVSDVKGGSRSAAKAIVSSVVISMALYILVAVSLLMLVPARQFSINADPLSFALRKAGAPGYFTGVVDVGALVATASASLALLLSSSRILYQIGADGLLPKVVKSYDPVKDVAKNGVLLSSVIGILMLFSGNVFVIASISNFGLLFSYLMATFSVVHFRRLKMRGPYSVPLFPYLPAAAMVAILAFMFGMPQEALVVGVILLLCLVILYYLLRELREKEPVKIRFFE